MLGRGRSGQRHVGKVFGRLFGGQVKVGENDDAGDRMLDDLSSPAGMRAGVKPLAQLEPEPGEHADHAGKEPPRAAEGMMVVVGPSQAQPILAGLLDPRRRVPRLPVVALDLEDQVARQVGRARQLDHALEARFGRGDSLFVVIKPPPASLPQVARRQGVAGRMRLHPPFARQLAREWLETEIAAPLDHGQRRPLARHAATR